MLDVCCIIATYLYHFGMIAAIFGVALILAGAVTPCDTPAPPPPPPCCHKSNQPPPNTGCGDGDEECAPSPTPVPTVVVTPVVTPSPVVTPTPATPTPVTPAPPVSPPAPPAAPVPPASPIAAPPAPSAPYVNNAHFVEICHFEAAVTGGAWNKVAVEAANLKTLPTEQSRVGMQDYLPSNGLCSSIPTPMPKMVAVSAPPAPPAPVVATEAPAPVVTPAPTVEVAPVVVTAAPTEVPMVDVPVIQTPSVLPSTGGDDGCSYYGTCLPQP